MNVRQLSYVLAVVDHGTFTKAAAELQIAQPSLSQGIRTLEAELGIELFVRGSRPVGLTPAGQALVEPARRAVRDLQTARAAVDAVRGLSGGRLDLVSLPTLSIDPVAGIVGRFLRAHPDVAVRLIEPEDTSDVARLVRAGTCELGVCDLPLPDATGLLSHHLATQGYQVVLPPEPERPQAGAAGTGRGPSPTATLTLADVAGLALVTTPVGTSTRRVVSDAMAAVGLEPRVAVETDHRESLIPLVLAGAGVAVVPDSLVASARRQGARVAVLDRPLTRDVGIIHRDGPLSPAAAAFFDLAPGDDAPDRR